MHLHPANLLGVGGQRGKLKEIFVNTVRGILRAKLEQNTNILFQRSFSLCTGYGLGWSIIKLKPEIIKLLKEEEKPWGQDY